ncbi:MAG: glycosyltransferase family 2 protein [Candidatus Ornithomonoglobus sp.]
MEDLISVIVPVYKVEKYLDRCIESLVNQTYVNLEIIIVDDGSPDNCGAMCDAWAEKDKRIKVIHKQNEGLGFARNSGLEVAHGKYVSFIDSDDYVSTSMYEIMYNALNKNNADTCLCGHYIKYTNKSVRNKIPFGTRCFKNKEIIDYILANMIGNVPEADDDYALQMCVWQGLFSKKIIDEYEIRFPSERQYISEDIIFDLKYYTYSKKLVTVDDCLYYYCMNGPSLTRLYRSDRFEKNKILHNEIMRQLKDYNDEFRLREARSFIGRCRLQLADIMTGADKKDRKKLVNEILNDTEVENILRQYPIDNMNTKYKIFFSLMKNKNKAALNCYMQLILLRNRIRS